MLLPYPPYRPMLSGTDLDYAATPAILRTRYARSSTDLGYATTPMALRIRYSGSSTHRGYATTPVSLRTRYAHTSTDRGYAATRKAHTSGTSALQSTVSYETRSLSKKICRKKNVLYLVLLCTGRIKDDKPRAWYELY